ncbi:MAG: adenylate/guanylate cyclase domain-containing protein, partial [Pseudomonadota bacterium]
MRRLTAILAADVVGFSAMMTRNEEETLNRLIAFRNKHFDPIVARHNGRIVKLTGDGALVEFASVVDALGCALAIQTGVAEDDSTPIQLRIGVNLGDIIVAGRDIYGDGVNIAARLEALAEPGGICASGLVIDSIGTRINAPFTEMGLQNLHNIETPVPVFQWVPGGRPIGPKPTNQGSDHHSGKASIAVLAFDNMSTDPEQEYFSDGIAEDIITALSHFRDFFVIARNTSFSYKGQQVPVTQICRDLGVRYVLEGSVRRSGNRVRVTAQLIDGSRDTHIWASKFDRGLDNIFDLQDEITQAIVASVAPETMRAETLRARSKRPENLTAWDRVLQARWHLGTFQKSSNQTARTLLEEALSADAENSDVHSAIAQCELMAMLHFWSEEP